MVSFDIDRYLLLYFCRASMHILISFLFAPVLHRVGWVGPIRLRCAAGNLKQMPAKRPEYRADRPHAAFLASIRSLLPQSPNQKQPTCTVGDAPAGGNIQIGCDEDLVRFGSLLRSAARAALARGSKLSAQAGSAAVDIDKDVRVGAHEGGVRRGGNNLQTGEAYGGIEVITHDTASFWRIFADLKRRNPDFSPRTHFIPAYQLMEQI